MSRLTATCSFTCGRREKNEDNFFFDGETLNAGARRGTVSLKKRWYSGNYCFGIFDGMGGLRGGEEASGLAAEVLGRLVRRNRSMSEAGLKRCFDTIHKSICQASEREGHALGSTGVILYVPKSLNAVYGNVGDSSLCLFRDGILSCLSVEHTDRILIERLGISGRTPELSQYLGMRGTMDLNPCAGTVQLCHGDRIVMYSDGLGGAVRFEEIERICGGASGSAECSKQLVSRALENGSEDNITVIVCDVV